MKFPDLMSRAMEEWQKAAIPMFAVVEMRTMCMPSGMSLLRHAVRPSSYFLRTSGRRSLQFCRVSVSPILRSGRSARVSPKQMVVTFTESL